jgi:hypothetical protein
VNSNSTWSALLAACGALLISTHNASAATLQSINDPILGAGALTRDAISGLDWLDWTYTRELSVSQTNTLLEPAGQLAGFRFATKSEVMAFFNHAGFSQLDVLPNGKAIDYDEAVQLVGLLGETRVTSQSVQSRALLAPGAFDPYFPNHTVEVIVNYNPVAHTGFAAANGGFAVSVGIDANAGEFQGHALVRLVPEPSGAALTSGLLGLLVLYRRRHVVRWIDRLHGP